MNKRNLGRWFAAFITVLLVSCGGGGGNAVSTSATKSNFEVAAVGKDYCSISWNMPVDGSTLENGTHYLFARCIALSLSPNSGAQEGHVSIVNMIPSLDVPNENQRYVKSGAIFSRGMLDKVVISYDGNNINFDYYDKAGTTKVYTSVIDEMSAPVPLVGNIVNNNLPEFIKSLINPEYVDDTKTWKQGAASFIRKAYLGSDRILVKDWTGSSIGTDVVPVTSSYDTLEKWFSSLPGGVGVNSRQYMMSDGSISAIDGVRAWISNNPHPYDDPTEQRVAFFELNSKIYYGHFTRSGTRIMAFDHLDYNIRFNKAAVESIADAIDYEAY